MEIIMIRDLVDGDILAKDILDFYGNPFLTRGTVLNYKYIDKLKSLGMMYVVVEGITGRTIEDADNKMNILKDKMVDALPEFFNKILCKKFNDQITIVDEMVNYIIKTGEINTNIFELRKYDNYNYIHCVNTSIMATYIGLKMGVYGESLRSLALGAILHDIGKVKISHRILNKKGKLTFEEYDEVKNHTIHGDNILEESNINNRIIRDIVLQHHEYVDGTGYPYGLKDKDISKFAKIVSLCDVFTALSANRSYRNYYNPNEAYEYIISKNNSMFHPDVVKVFKENFVIYPRGCKVKISNDMVGVVVNQNKGFPDRPIIKIYYENNKTNQIQTQKINLLELRNIVITEVIMNM